jgi:hypothetical protein
MTDSLAQSNAATYPVILRHRDANRQSIIFVVFADLLLLMAIAGFFFLEGSAKAFAAIPLLGMLPFGYAAMRLFTLKVRVDETGVWEPDPFRLTYVTPWSDLTRAERVSSGKRIALVGVRIVHADGEKHEIEALKMQAGAAAAEPTVDGWIQAINDAKARFRS